MGHGITLPSEWIHLFPAQQLKYTAIAAHLGVSAGIMAYTVRRRSVDDVKNMMAAAESPAAAVTRVVNTMHGRKAGDVDGDDDLLVSNTVISLKDPLSGTRIQKAARSSSGLVHFFGFTVLQYHAAKSWLQVCLSWPFFL